MTTEREAAGPDGAHEAAHHGPGTSAPHLLWQRRATVVDEAHASFQLPGGAGDLLGWTTSDLQCAPYLEFVHPDDRDVLAEAGDDLRTSSTPTVFVPLEMRLLARDRRYWWTRWTVALTEDGSSVRAAGVDYLAPQSTKGPPVGTWLWDTRADTVSWSTELLDMFGFRVGPPVAYRDFLAAVLEDDRDGIDRAIRQTLADAGPYEADFGIADSRGREHWFHAAGRLLDHPAGGRRLLGGLLKYLNPVPRGGEGAGPPTGCG
jgi:PAS domain-containing protein